MPLSTAERFRRLGLEVVGQEARLLEERSQYRPLRTDEQRDLRDCKRVLAELRELTFPATYHEGPHKAA